MASIILLFSFSDIEMEKEMEIRMIEKNIGREEEEANYASFVR